jgi:hypothetical protein
VQPLDVHLAREALGENEITERRHPISLGRRPHGMFLPRGTRGKGEDCLELPAQPLTATPNSIGISGGHAEDFH